MDNVEELTAALRRGDEPAWCRFHDEYYPRLYRWMVAVSHGDEEAAAEAAHRAFLKSVRSVPLTHDSGGLWKWLTRLARCAYIDEWRKTQARGRLMRRWFDRSLPPGLCDTGDPMDVLQECLAGLSGDDRALLEEKYFSVLTVREMAAARNTTEKALESRLTRARERLRTAIQQQIHEI